MSCSATRGGKTHLSLTNAAVQTQQPEVGVDGPCSLPSMCGWSQHWGHWAPHLLIWCKVHQEPDYSLFIYFPPHQGCSVKTNFWLIRKHRTREDKSFRRDLETSVNPGQIQRFHFEVPSSPWLTMLSVSISFLRALVARGQFVTESTSFSHLDAAIPRLVCTNKRGWHVPTYPPALLLLQTWKYVPATDSHAGLERVILPIPPFSAWDGLHKLLPWESQSSSLSWDTARCKWGHQMMQAR